MRARLYRIWEQLVIRFVYLTGKGKRTRQWRHYVRSEASRKAWVTRKHNKAARVGAAQETQAGPVVSSSFTPEPGQSSATYEDHESDAVHIQ